MQRIVADVNGKQSLRRWKPGPKPKGFVPALANIPAEHLAVMQYRREQCGGALSVNQQIRDAVRGYLCGLVYASLYIP